MSNRPWTKEEEQNLAEWWGYYSVDCIAERLGRTPTAVITRKNKLRLGSFLSNNDNITYQQLVLTLGYSYANSGRRELWVEKRKMPVTHRKIAEKSILVIKLDDFWLWAENNQDLLDFSNFEKYALGKEPDWVDKKRHKDILRSREITTKPWTKTDDSRLVHLLHKGYSYERLRKELKRTESAIVNRLVALGIKERPASNEKSKKWSEQELDKVRRLILAGESYEEISEKTGRRTSLIQGAMYIRYKTKSLVKLKKIFEQQGTD